MKTMINKLGAVGIVFDADPVEMPLNALTDALNVRFAGREIEQCLGSKKEPYYQTDVTATAQSHAAYLVQPILFDAYSAKARQVYTCHAATTETQEVVVSFYVQNMDTPDYKYLSHVAWPQTPWTMYKGQINNCPFFGMAGQAPQGKQYDWTTFSTLPGFGEQTGGDQVVVTREWSCRKMVAFGNRLLMLNTVEEDGAGISQPYPARVRWSGFTQQNAFPINWDDTAANRVPPEYAAATIDGIAGWMDLGTDSQIIDACDNGGTLYVYTERETFALTPSGNANSPFIVKRIYSDLGAQDLSCAVNAKGYNYIFTGNDFVRHDSVRWESLAEGVVRDWLAEVVVNPMPGAVRVVNYPELNEVWVMTKGTDQLADDCAKTQCLTYNYIAETWGRKSLPYIYDAAIVPLAPGDESAERWDDAAYAWDADTEEWGGGQLKIAQGAMVGSCAAGGIYYLNNGYKESRHVFSGSTWAMQEQDLHCYIERKAIDLNDGLRQIITKTELRGRGADALSISTAGAESPDAGYYWERQDLASLVDERRQTWMTEGQCHAFRMELFGRGAIPSALTIYHEDSGE
ncbi:hypothetical protein [Buttiauxella sp. A111]|uniref:hypothetical protein n=1 Tax=Buttiauxella sp. A111 TaxID=2563088 RepID=UPI0010D8E023|nr:hypothetical protein [Buttiauxella sp. A111]GDX06337.1 hypothetical protein BSPA111_25460 [Buttiauxella sp. A111]